MSAINNTPELDFQSIIIESGQSELLGKFYDWLTEQGIVLAKWGGYDYESETYHDDILSLYSVHPEKLFADFFGLDLNKIEAERRAILEELRNSYD